MSDNSRRYMEMALDIAFSGLGKTSPNPSVGAVIVKNGEIVSKGGTSPYGSDHAEVVAIKNSKVDLVGADIYVSLEPCCHYDKTPPCIDAIIHSKISRVYIPLLDPNPVVAGKGATKLREAGVDVVVMTEMADKAYDLIRQFRKYILNKTPYVIHKSAVTLDGRIATREYDSKWISSEYSRYIAHRLRSLVDAVIIGKNTFLGDDPTLNVRLDSFSDEVKEYFNSTNISISGRENYFLKRLLESVETENRDPPVRVVIGIPLEFDFTKNFFFDDNYIFFAEEKRRSEVFQRSGNHTLQKMIEDGRLVFIKGETRTDQIDHILNNMYNRGKMTLMLEGGGAIADSFFNAEKIDQFCYFISPKVIGGGRNPIEGKGRKNINEALQLHDVSTVMIKEDVLYNAYAEQESEVM